MKHHKENELVQLNIKRMVYVFCIILNFGSADGQSIDKVKLDSIVNVVILNSEEALFNSKFDDALKSLELPYLKNLLEDSPKNRILLEVQRTRITGYKNIVYAQKSNDSIQLERLLFLLPLTKMVDDQNILGRYFLALSNAYKSTGLAESSSLYLDRAISNFHQANNFEEIAKIRASLLSAKHMRLFRENKKDEILKLIPKYEKELEYSLMHSKFALSYNTRHLAQIYRRQTNDYESSIKLFKQSLELRIELGFRPFIPASYSSIGDVYMKMEDYTRAIEFYSKSSELAEEIGFIRYQIYPIIQIGECYQNKGDTDIALGYYSRALKIAVKNDYPIEKDQLVNRIESLK